MQIKELALMIANEYWWMKVSELMLFFYRFKAGMYGKFYGAVDPMVITSSLIQFVEYRSKFFDKIDSEENKKRLEADSKRETISYEEYCHRVGKSSSELQETAKNGIFNKTSKKPQRSVEDILKSARSIIANEAGLDECYQNKVIDLFVREHKMTPAEYISKHELKNN
jgi:hypothetical protein